MTTEATEPAARVSALELFFDLVFVFTLTQLTGVLTDDFDAGGLGRVLVMLSIVMWMYGGYAWLTNAIAVGRTDHRLLLLGGMAGFLVMALAIPQAADGDGLAFGLAYLFVVLLHATLFTRAESERSARAILGIAPYNLASALLVVIGGALGGEAQWAIWSFAALLEWGTPFLGGIGEFEIGAEHFVERHGLLIIVALGESVIAVGIGAGGQHVDAGLAATAVLCLGLSACLWWAYFGDERAIEDAMARAGQRERPRMALIGFGYAHAAMLLGVIVVAAALKKVIAHPFDALDAWPAVLLAAGAMLFVVSDAAFRRVMRLTADSRARLVAAALAPAMIALGIGVAAFAQLAGLVALLALGFAAESRVAQRSPHAPGLETELR